jgi:hypothetical protein
MGYTQHTKEVVEKYVKEFSPKNILDLGSQNDFSQPLLPAPYISEWYKSKGIFYECIDLNKENEAWAVDLSKPFENTIGDWKGQFVHTGYDFLLDIGTSEHVGNNGVHDIESYYNCWKTKHNLCKISGLIISENPKSNNWPGHGFNYVTQEFYKQLASVSGYIILDLHEHAACGNITDGWNVFCVMEKISDKFPDLETFKTLDVKTS